MHWITTFTLIWFGVIVVLCFLWWGLMRHVRIMEPDEWMPDIKDVQDGE